MGKRSDFERVPRDYYPTPLEAAVPLFKHLPPHTKFIEPCAGDGRLVRHLESDGHDCVYACDIEPQDENIEKRDVLFFDSPFPPCDLIITNTPWEREVLHAMIDRFTNHCDCWLLFDADWIHTIQAAPFMPYLQKIVSIGRVKWFEDSDNTGTDNACWYRFSKNNKEPTIFIGR